MLSLADKFRDREISQTDIVRVSFELQVEIATRKRGKKAQYEQAFNTLADSLVDILIELMNRDDSKSLPIINVIPSILQQVDPQQTRLPRVIEAGSNFERIYELFHSLGELPLSSSSSECLESRIVALLEQDPQNGSSLLNLATFLYETHRNNKWAFLVRRIFNELPRRETADCALFIKSRKACLRELATAICSAITQSHELLDIDLFLLMVLSSCECTYISKTLKLLAKRKLLHSCSLEYPVGTVNLMDIIDCFCCLCATKESASQVSYIARLLVEIFLQTENVEILTFAIFNEDENKVLLEASIQAIVLAAKSDARLLDEKLDVCAVLSIVSRPVMEQLIRPLSRATHEVPSLLDRILLFLKKMLTRPSQMRLAIHCFEDLIDVNQSPDFQREILSFLVGQISSPYMRYLIFRCLSKVTFTSEMVGEILELLSRYPVSFEHMLRIGPNGFVVPCDLPAATVELSLKLGVNPQNYQPLIRLSTREFDSETSLVLQLALRADVLCLLAPYSRDAFCIFCEFFRAIEVLAQEHERGIIAEWCSLRLDKKFVIDELDRIDAETDPILCYSIIRQIGFDGTVGENVIGACYKLFGIARQDGSEKYTPICKLLGELHQDIFSENYIRFREEFIVLLSKHARLTSEEVEKFAILDSMVEESLTFDLTSRHFDAYLTILEKTMDVSENSHAKLANVLTTLSIEDRKLLQRVIMLIFSKSPEESAFRFGIRICDTLSSSSDSSILLRNKSLKIAAAVSVCEWLGKVAGDCEDIEGLFLECFERVLEIQEANRTLCKAVLRMIDKTAKALLNREFGKARQLRTICEMWFDQWRAIAGIKECGQSSARIHMLVHKDKVDLDGERKVKRFVDRKWRSKVRWINDGLREESDSEDNFADLEDFVVDETPPESENEEESYSDY